MATPTARRRPLPDILDSGFLKLVAVALLLIGAIFGLMQPAGSSALGRAGAILFWMLHAVAAIPCIAAAVWFLSRLRISLSPWIFVFVSGVIAAVGLSLAALGLEILFGVQDNDPGDVMLLKSLGLLGLWLDEFGGLAPPFVLAWVLINLPRLTRLGMQTSPPLTVPASPSTDESEPVMPPQPPRDIPAPEILGPSDGLLEKLPEALGTDVVLLTSDLHYLHVHTPRGRTMLLYSLSDAESELGANGIRVHRSHWVADRHVRGLLSKRGTLMCQLTGGLEVPVSRRRQADVVARYGRDTRYHPPA